jgi:hypothetical protein
MDLAMFLKAQEAASGDTLAEVLDLKQLFDPFSTSVRARLHGGEELQDPKDLEKSQLSFPSGEPLPRCWTDPNYQNL